MPTWPTSLPQKTLATTYNEAPQSQVLRSSMDSGPAKTRRRFTAATMTVPFECHLTLDQIPTFEAFYSDDIAAGALPFDIPHPRTGATVSVLLKGDPPYQLAPVGAGATHYRLSLILEIQP